MSVIKVWTIQDQLFNGTAIACEAGEPIGISFILVRNQKKIQGFFAFYIYIYTLYTYRMPLMIEGKSILYI